MIVSTKRLTIPFHRMLFMKIYIYIYIINEVYDIKFSFTFNNRLQSYRCNLSNTYLNEIDYQSNVMCYINMEYTIQSKDGR